MEEGENVEREGGLDDEEGICSPQTRNKNPTSKPEEKGKNESIKLEEGRTHTSSVSVSESERDGEKDLKESKHVESLVLNLNGSGNSKEDASVKTASDMKDENKFSSKDFTSQPESEQMKIPQNENATVPVHDIIKQKAESSPQDKENNSQPTCTENLVNTKATTNVDKSQQPQDIESEIKEEENLNKKQRKVNESEESSTNMKSEIGFEKKQMTNANDVSAKHEIVVESDASTSMVKEEGPNRTTQESDKLHKTEAVKPLEKVEQPPDKSKGKKEITRIIQEKKQEIPSTSNEKTKPFSHKTDTGTGASSKTMAKSHLRTDTIDNKPTKSKSMELNKAVKDVNERKLKQKQTKDTTTLSPSHKLKSPARSLENSKQKSASTGTLSKPSESKQKQSEPQPSITQEKSAKSKDIHMTKDGSSRSPAKTKPVKNLSEKVTPKSVQSSDENIAEKPVVTVFQGTVTKPTKSDEKVQRSTSEARKNQERLNKVTAEITATTEAAIKEQFKQLECKLPHELPVQNKPGSPKQVPKSPTRRQVQPKQQKPTQQKLQDQKQLLQKQSSPQKQKPPRSPTRKQQEQKQLQQKQQPLKQQQKQQQAQKELAQPKQHTSQIQATNLSKQDKQQVSMKQTKQQEVPQQGKQGKQDQKQEKPLPEEKAKQQTCKVQQQVLTPQVKQIKQQDDSERQQEQNFACLKESKDQEQKEQCEKPIMQQDKDIIEQHNLQQKQREQEEAMAKQLEDQKQEKQQHKEDQPDQSEQKEHSKQQLQEQSEDGDEDGGVCGMQGRSCPIYFGVKSYLHQFYDSTPIKNSPLYEEYIEEDDFEYAVDPIKNRGCRRCCRGFWFRAGLWGGINLILVGVITLLVGYLTPQREMVVGYHNNLEILDRSAIAFNRRLELCRLAGLAVFCCGGLVLLLTLLLSSFFHIGNHNNNNSQCCGDNAYYGYVSTSLVEPFIAAPNQTVPVSTGIKIPITEQIKSVQPTLWPDIAAVKDGNLVPHIP